MKRTTKRFHRILSLLCALVMIAGLINPMTLKATAVDVYAAPAGAIEIDSPEDLMKIGKDANYPLSGDYVLTADLDMTGIDYTPIGGMEGSKGTTSGVNVFNGTFDGQGHLIANLTMNIEYTATGQNYIQMGMFSVIASNDPDDYAVVENIVFANVSITADVKGGLTAAGTLAGEVNGYATVQNIAVLDGSVYINGFAQSDTVGVGGLIGECRTEGAPFNNNITIKNIYNGAEVLAGSSTGSPFAGGIVGRLRGSNVKELSGCVNTGRISYRGETASAIAAIASGADDSCIRDCYFLFTHGNPSGEGTSELEEKTLKSGVLPTGLDSKVWYASEGSFPLLQICKNEGPSGYLGLMSLNPEFAGDENASCVTQDFTLPGSVGDVKVTWTSSNPDIIEVKGTTAVVKGAMAETRVILTATTSDGKTRNYTIVVLSNVDAEFEQLYVKAGSPLTVTIKNAPEDLECTYAWSVDGQSKPAVTGNSYTPTASDNESFIKVVVTAKNYNATWEESIYMSDLPVVYIDTEDGQDVFNKDVYKYANIKIQGNDYFPSEDVLYDGLTEIKGRGNSTWDYAASNNLKKPYRLKFDGKADVLGMGKSKHWVLLANVIDHTSMRNELIYEFSEDIGMECVMDFEPCVVILNGKYHGMYQIGEHKRVDEGRIEIFDWEGLGEEIAAAIADKEGITGKAFDDFEEYVGALDFSWLDTGVVNYNGKTYKVSDYYKGTIPEFTGGFAFDMDFRLQQSKFISKFYTDYGYPMFFEAPEYAKTSPIMMEYAQTYLQAFENAIHDDDYYAVYDGEEVHYSEVYDIESLMQNWYVVEYSMNWDAMKNSTLMYKDLDTEEGRSLMKMGPVWDFDWAWGNMNMYSNATVWQVQGWHTTMDSFCEVSYQRENWNRYLISDPYFAMLVYEKWPQVRAVMEDMIKDGGKIDQLEEYYREAAHANDERWKSTYGRYGGYGITNGQVVRKQSEEYDQAVVTMEYFVKNRVAWFDTQFTSVEKLLESWGRYKGSNELEVLDIDAHDDGTNTITATTYNDKIKKIAFYVNGIRSGEVDVVDGIATLTVEDSALRASVNKEALDNCVQIRAMDANGNFVKNGSNVLTNYDIFEKYVEDKGAAAEVADSIVINEVESSDADGGNDWVEIYNKGTKAVDISGWFITDDKGLDRLTSGATTPLPEGTMLEPGAFFVLEENVNFTCGLGSGDTVTLYDANSNEVDVVTWDGHVDGTVSRVPDGTGKFSTQAPSKGVSNNPIAINEIESSDPYDGSDWVEIYNKGANAVDISGWFVADDKGLDRLTSGATTPLPEGTVLEPGEFFVLEENVNFTCGLGSGDTVYLYDKDSNLMDTATWLGHAEGTLSRVPDGTGTFVDQDATKGATNVLNPNAVNKSGLQSAVTAAEKLVEVNYTEDTWAAMQAVLTDAKAVLAKEDATQAAVDAAEKALADAMSALKEAEKEPVDDSVVINEVESSDPNEGPDWVELYNKSDKAVDISGWFVTDDKGLDRLTAGETTPLPEGTVLNPGEYYVLEENVNFTCGLGSADGAYLFNQDSQEVDSVTWTSHAAEALARVPDGTGDFVDQAATKGIENVKKEILDDPLETLAYFDFNVEPEEGESFDGGNAVADGTYTLVEHDDGQALKLDGNQQFLTVTAKDGTSLLTGLDELTVSFLLSPEKSSTNWTFFAAPDDTPPSYPNEHYLGILESNGNVSAERFDNEGSRPTKPGATTPYSTWYHVTVVFTAATADAPAETIIYIDGVEVARETSEVAIADMLGEESVLYIGKATWSGGEYATAMIDNYKIYDHALTEKEVLNEFKLGEYDPNEKVELPYEDVTEADWFYDAVHYNFVEKTMTGLDDKHFGPYGQLSRAQFALILYRIEGEPEFKAEKSFGDISGDEWYGPAVLWAAQAGVVNGYLDGNFGPTDNITREQMALMMYRYAEYLEKEITNEGDLSKFQDEASVSGFAKEAMEWATDKGIITGKGSDEPKALDPQGNTARCEAAAIIERFMTAYAE